MDNNLPLQDIKIVTLAYNLPGPVAAQKLAGLGAAVTRVEPPKGDPFSRWCPQWYADLCAGQQIIRLDLKTAAGQGEMESLLEKSDLFISSIRPSALAALALDFPALRERYPRLCMVSITGYPAPDQNLAGHDLTYQAAFGLLTPPQPPRTLIADMAGAQETVNAALALLYARERGQGAGYREIALSTSAALFAEPLKYGLTAPDGLLGGKLPRYRLYETRKGHIALAVLEEHFWERLCNKLGLNHTTAETHDLQDKFWAMTAMEWESWGTSNDLPILAVR